MKSRKNRQTHRQTDKHTNKQTELDTASQTQIFFIFSIDMPPISSPTMLTRSGRLPEASLWSQVSCSLSYLFAQLLTPALHRVIILGKLPAKSPGKWQLPIRLTWAGFVSVMCNYRWVVCLGSSLGASQARSRATRSAAFDDLLAFKWPHLQFPPSH